MTSKRQKQSGFILPTVINPAGRWCVKFEIPADPAYRQAATGLIWEFGKWWTWEKSYTPGDTRAKEAAELFREILNDTLQIGECEPMPEPITPLFDFREDCIMYVSYDDGINWTPIPGWSTYALGCFKGDQGEPGAPGVDGADGLPGAPGADGADGCSPFVWVEDRPTDDHKILHIDNDCDEVNEYSIDLTAENSSASNTYWVCRMSRAIVRNMAGIIVSAESGALPVWDQQIFDLAFTNAFRGAGLIHPTAAPGNGFSLAMTLLFAEGQAYNQALSDSLQDDDQLQAAIEDMFVSVPTPELSTGNIAAYIGRIENAAPELQAPLQKWIAYFLTFLWGDTRDLVENWVWSQMARPGDGDCSMFVPTWEHVWDFADGAQEFSRTTGVETVFGLQTEDFFQGHILDFRWSPNAPLTITDISMTATVISPTGLARLNFNYVGSSAWTPILGEDIDQTHPTRTYHYLTPVENVDGIMVYASDPAQDGEVLVTRLVLRGTGYNPFV